MKTETFAVQYWNWDDPYNESAVDTVRRTLPAAEGEGEGELAEEAGL